MRQPTTAGDVVCRRSFARDDSGYLPGQHEVQIMDPRPHRDRADLAAIVTYIDDERMACSLMCFRYRDERGWQSIKVHRASMTKIGRATVVGKPDLTGKLAFLVEAAAVGWEPFPFEEPDEDEQSIRRLAHALMDEAERRADDAKQ